MNPIPSAGERAVRQDRFYYDGSWETESVELTGSEAHHLLHVLRAEPGRRVVLFDGRGREALAEVESCRRKTVRLRLLEVRAAAEPRSPQIVLATAVPKADRFRWLVEKATELGIDRLIPLQTARTTVEPRSNRLEKLQQTAIAACKQCGRSRLMEIDQPMPWEAFIAQARQDGPLYIADARGVPAASAVPDRPVDTLHLAVGPEGGFTEEEIETGVEAGGRLVALGPHTLRTETAAVAISLWAVWQTTPARRSSP